MTNAKNRGKQWNGKDYRSLQENWRYQGNFSCKDEHNEGQKWYGPNKQKILRGDKKYTELYRKDLHDPDNHNGVNTRARHPGMQNQVGLRKHHYELS